MTKEEFCQQYGYSLQTLKTSFNRTKESLSHKGYILTREGSWPNANYTVVEDKSLIPPKKITLSTRLIGQRFGHLTVLKDTGKRFYRSIVWDCVCDCGRHHEATSNNLSGGHVKSCANMDCPYSKTYDDLTNQKFGLLTALYPTSMKDGSHMYWMCKCDCGNLKEVSSSSLKSHTVQSCGCLKQSVGELNIKKILEQNNINFCEQYTFADLKNKKPLRFDFAIFKDNQLFRLVEFDGIQHYEEQAYFSHSLAEIQQNDKIKNEYCQQHNIILVRIPYWERDNITLDMIMGDKYIYGSTTN